MLKFENFVELIEANIVEYLPKGYADAEVRVAKVKKNNGEILNGLVVLKKGENISPTIYLEHIYDEYITDAKSIDSVLTKMAEVIMDNEFKSTFDLEDLTVFEKVKDRIYPRLLNYEMNKNILEERPYVKIEDLIVVFSIVLDTDGEHMSSTIIHNQLMNDWNVTTEELYEVAMENLEKSITVVNPIMEIMAMLTNNKKNECFDVDDNNTEPLIITNDSHMFGASVVLKKSLMDRLLDKMNTGFYLLPASIHEMILVPKDEKANPEALKELVRTANREVVDIKEKLSDEVYTYTRENGLVKI